MTRDLCYDSLWATEWGQGSIAKHLSSAGRVPRISWVTLSQQNTTKQTRDVTRRVHALQPRPRYNTIHDAPHSHILRHSQTSHASTNTDGQTRARRVRISEEIEETKGGACIHRRHPPHQTWIHGTHRRAEEEPWIQVVQGPRDGAEDMALYYRGDGGDYVCPLPLLLSSNCN